jgi:hypothetical protein
MNSPNGISSTQAHHNMLLSNVDTSYQTAQHCNPENMSLQY